MNYLKSNDVNENPSDSENCAIDVVDKPCTLAEGRTVSISNQSNSPSDQSLYSRIFQNEQVRPTPTIVTMLRVVFLIMIVFLTVIVIYVIVPALEGDGNEMVPPSIDEQQPNHITLIIPASIQDNEHLIDMLDSFHTNCTSCSSLHVTIVTSASDIASLQDVLAQYVNKFPLLHVMTFNMSTNASSDDQSITGSVAACLLSTNRYCWFASSASTVIKPIDLSMLTSDIANQAVVVQSIDQSTKQSINTPPSDSATPCRQTSSRVSVSWFNGTSIAVVNRVGIRSNMIESLNVSVTATYYEAATGAATDREAKPFRGLLPRTR